MKYAALSAIAFSLLPAVAIADPYPSTLNQEEQERHEFLDAQRGLSAGVHPSFGRHRAIAIAPGQALNPSPTQRDVVSEGFSSP